jgi:hypothetical protein
MPDDALFHDPVYDGATDPTVVRHRDTGEWWMFYTQRRATVDEPGVAWVHGSRIGVARSADRLDWRYAGTVAGLELGTGEETHWAPEVIDDGERYRMYLTVIDGIPDRWEGHPRRIVEYVSDDLARWHAVGEVPLSSDRVIDACVAHCPDGRWRLWYKDEADDSTTWVAASDDLASWRVEGRAIGGRPHEGPNVFQLGGWWWMLVDEWRGMGVHRSADAVTWERQGGDDEVILGEPGRRVGDETFGRHGDVVVEDGEAMLYYFTHPHWDGSELGSSDAAEARRSAVFAAPLVVVDGRLVCERDTPPGR